MAEAYGDQSHEVMEGAEKELRVRRAREVESRGSTVGSPAGPLAYETQFRQTGYSNKPGPPAEKPDVRNMDDS